MFKKLMFSLMLLSSLAFAGTLKVGDSIKPFDLKDQFDKSHNVNSKDYDILIVAFEKDVASWVNEYLKGKDFSYLSKNKTLFISDISGMPSLITKWFALPKMKKYNYPLLLIYEESDLFPKKEGALTILKIKENKISDVSYITDAKEIKSIF